MTDTRETRCPDENHPTCSFFVGLGRFELPTFGPPDALTVFHQSRWFQLARDFDPQTHRIELSELQDLLSHLSVVTRIVTRSGRSPRDHRRSKRVVS